MKHFTSQQAVRQWKEFADVLRRGIVERDLDLRESFETGERTLSDGLRAEVERADELVRQHPLRALTDAQLLDEYRNLGAHRPQEFWWWHVKEDRTQ